MMHAHAKSHWCGIPKRHFWLWIWLWDPPRHWVSQNEKQNWDANGKGSSSGVSGRLRARLCEESSDEVPSTSWLGQQVWNFTTKMYTGINCKPLASNFCTISLPSAHAGAYTNRSAHKSEQNQLPVPALFHPHLAFAEITLYFMAP